jgi:hypothetical protein
VPSPNTNTSPNATTVTPQHQPVAAPGVNEITLTGLDRIQPRLLIFDYAQRSKVTYTEKIPASAFATSGCSLRALFLWNI